MEYLLGGYYLIKPIERPEYMDKNIIPDSIFSASSCICDFYPEMTQVWTDSKKIKNRYISELNFTKSTFDQMEKWIDEEFNRKEFGFPHVFNSVGSAKNFYRKFFLHIPDMKLIGIGLPEEFVEEFQEEFDVPDYFYGVEFNIQNNKCLASDGNILGYEILGYEYGSFHSYLCNSLYKDYSQVFPFKLNQNGFIKTLEEAIHLSQFTNDELDAEPVLWLPWIVKEYSL